MQIEAEEARTLRGCAGGLRRFFALAGRKTAGISRAGRGEGYVGKSCSAHGKKSEEQDSEGYGPEIECAHELKIYCGSMSLSIREDTISSDGMTEDGMRERISFGPIHHGP